MSSRSLVSVGVAILAVLVFLAPGSSPARPRGSRAPKRLAESRSAQPGVIRTCRARGVTAPSCRCNGPTS